VAIPKASRHSPAPTPVIVDGEQQAQSGAGREGITSHDGADA
jgi:hypothetical protein